MGKEISYGKLIMVRVDEMWEGYYEKVFYPIRWWFSRQLYNEIFD